MFTGLVYGTYSNIESLSALEWQIEKAGTRAFQREEGPRVKTEPEQPGMVVPALITALGLRGSWSLRVQAQLRLHKKNLTSKIRKKI